MAKSKPSYTPGEIPAGRPPESPNTIPKTPDAPSTAPDRPETPPAIHPDLDPDLPEKPGPPLSDPESPRG